MQFSIWLDEDENASISFFFSPNSPNVFILSTQFVLFEMWQFLLLYEESFQFLHVTVWFCVLTAVKWTDRTASSVMECILLFYIPVWGWLYFLLKSHFVFNLWSIITLCLHLKHPPSSHLLCSWLSAKVQKLALAPAESFCYFTVHLSRLTE